MELYRIEVGLEHSVQPSNIVGAIANEAGISSEFIGRIDIFEEYSTVTLPEGMPPQTLKVLKKAWIGGRQLRLSRLDANGKPVDNKPTRLRPKRKPRKTTSKKRTRRALKRAAR